MANSKPAAAITQGQTGWLSLSALGALLPLTPYLPYWLGALCVATVLWHGWMLWRRFPMPSRWLVNIAAVAGATGIGLHFHTIFGKEPGVALLALFLSLKLYETRNPRDAFAVVLLCLFLILSQFFYTQSMATAAAMAAATLISAATLIVLQRSTTPARQALRSAGLMLLQALPFMVLLFFLFPRISGPLWGLPADAQHDTTGLTDTMSPGSISQLSRSDAIAFRVQFEGEMPPREQLYWRGPVLTQFDGQSWRMLPPLGFSALPYAPSGKRYRYETTLEPHNQRWLLALDYPAELPAAQRITPAFQLLSEKPVTNRLRYALSAAPDTQPGAKELSSILKIALQLPANGNPRSRALANELRQSHRNDKALIAALLDRICSENFVYTLNPPLLGRDSVDEFLFDTRRGFCEHYASAFVFLLRAAGIPARVVTGYQGGEINPVDGYLLVRQSDAHAWAEVWLAGEGWRRVDPTAAVAPNRVENNLAAAVPAGDPLPLLTRPELDWLRQLRFRWEAVNNAWNQWVLGYDNQKQMALLKKLGLESPDWQTLAALLAGSAGALLLAMSLWVMGQRRRVDPLQHLWQRFDAKLAKRNLGRHPWEGAVDYARRLQAALPDQAREIAAICGLYETLRYGRVGTSGKDSLALLKHRIDAFTPSRKIAAP
ncbi:MAG: DUF3488 domain-containing protein [Rhodocyclaceae bacterium]|nr:MAG: DUF3488 domain-containing protein [Rhodocyclaceae bacterium]